MIRFWTLFRSSTQPKRKKITIFKIRLDSQVIRSKKRSSALVRSRTQTILKVVSIQRVQLAISTTVVVSMRLHQQEVAILVQDDSLLRIVLAPKKFW